MFSTREDWLVLQSVKHSIKVLDAKLVLAESKELDVEPEGSCGAEVYSSLLNTYNGYKRILDKLEVRSALHKSEEYVRQYIRNYTEQGLSKQEIHNLLEKREIFRYSTRTEIAHLIIDTLTD